MQLKINFTKKKKCSYFLGMSDGKIYTIQMILFFSPGYWVSCETWCFKGYLRFLGDVFFSSG